MAQSVKVDFDCFKDTFKRFKKLSVQELDGHVINFRDPKKFGQEVEQVYILQAAASIDAFS